MAKKKCNDSHWVTDDDGKWLQVTGEHNFVQVGNTLQCKNCPKVKPVNAKWLQEVEEARIIREEEKDLAGGKKKVSLDEFNAIVLEKATNDETVEEEVSVE